MKGYLCIVPLCFSLCVFGQNVDRRDTLDAARITASHLEYSLTKTKVDIKHSNKIISPTGQADIIKYIQTLPGVSMGAEGGSSYYVRGGNYGNNAIELDGVRIFATSHLLGVASSLPIDICSSINYTSGGFEGEHSNVLSSIVQINSSNGNLTKTEAAFSISNFFAGAQVSVPVIKGKASLLCCANISPFQYEYKMFRALASGFDLEIPQDVKSSIGDCFTKLHWQVGKETKLDLSYYFTGDKYDFIYRNAVQDRMAWKDNVINFSLSSIIFDNLIYNGTVSWNRFENAQEQERLTLYSDELNVLSSSLGELMAKGTFSTRLNKKIIQSFGYIFGRTTFRPRSYGGEWSENISHNSKTRASQVTLWYQVDYKPFKSLYAHSMVRGNYFNEQFYPEFSLSLDAPISTHLTLNASFDYLSQQYHLVEGIPMGWPIDFYLPATESHKAERAIQQLLQLICLIKRHSFTMGVYNKRYDNLVFSSNSSNLFNKSSLDNWTADLYVGEGWSKGVESKYRYSGKKLGLIATYTLSSTDRFFEGLNDNRIFHAKYDRTHILNLSSDFEYASHNKTTYGITAFFTLQSGAWETSKSGEYIAIFPWKSGSVDYYGSLNNFRLPTYIRLDLGSYASWDSGRCTHRLSFGIFNVLNRHNPSVIYGDSITGEWKQVSFFPIMPSFSYKISL
mgnify:FL=1